MDFLNNFARNMASILVCGALKEARYSCCFNSYLEEHIKERGDLITKRDSVQNRVKNAQRQTKETDSFVINWLDEANTLIRKAERLEEKVNVKRSCCLGHCPNWIKRYTLGKQLAEQKETIVEHNKNGINFIQVESLVQLPGMEFYSSENFICFESTKLAFDELLEALKDDKVFMIGLYGMGGCGKTTLAKQVGKEAEKVFDKVVLATVSNTVDVRIIQAKIADSLDLEFKEEDVSGRAKRLWLRLKGKERILIILDDVWEKLDLEAIGIPSSDNCNVLLTTRRQQVCTLMDCQRIIHLNLLDKIEAWSLFQHYARITGQTLKDLRQLAQQISEKCDGLPVAISAVASSLKGKTKEEWKETWETMRNSKPLDVEDGLENPYTCLKLSYDNLKDQKAKLLFSLCSVFPEDFEISLELLTRFVKGLDLFGKVDSYERLRDQVIAAKNRLINSCLLLQENNLDGEFVKMHDFVRDVALWIAKEEFKLVMEFERSQSAHKENATVNDSVIKYLCCEAFSNHLNYPKLQFLFVSTHLYDAAISDAFFEGLKELKVLALDNKGNQRPILIRAKQLLTNLCCMYLRGWELDGATCAFIGSLKRLESLALFNCSINLEETFERNVSNEVIARYTAMENLEELRMTSCQGFKRMMFFGKPSLFKLKVIQLSFCRELVNVFTPVIAQSLKQLEELQITGCVGLQYIFGHDNNEDQSPYQIQDEFQIELSALKVLKLIWLTNLVSICPENYYLRFPSLHEFFLEDCTRFNEKRQQHGSELTAFGIQTQSLQNLIRLQISNCNIRYIFSTTTAESLPLLEELIVEYCWELKEIFIDMEHQDVLNGQMEPCKVDDCLENTSMSSAIVVDNQHPHNRNSGSFNLCSLQKLKLMSCPKLTTVFPASTAERLNSLEDLKIEYCESLEYVLVFPISSVRCLPKLNKINIRYSPKLEFVFGQSDHEDFSLHQYQNKVPINLPALEVLNLRSLPALISICPNNYYVTCPSLQELFLGRSQWSTLSTMNMLVSSDAIHSNHRFLKELEAVIKLVQNLRSLVIRSEEKIEVIFDLEKLSIDGQKVTSGLTYLFLVNLPKLKSIWMGIAKHILTLQNLEKVIIWDCQKLKTIFPSSTIRSLHQLKILLIANCEELEQIIEEDEENHTALSPPHSRQICCPLIGAKRPEQRGQATCFPQLKVLFIRKCNKLKHVLSFSTLHEFPKLEKLIIIEASNIEKVFDGKARVTDEGNDVMFPQLEHLILMNLPMLANVCQGVDFHKLAYRVVLNCQQLSLTPTATFDDFKQNYQESLQDIDIDPYTRSAFIDIIETVIEEATKDSIPRSEATSQLEMGLEDRDSGVEAKSEKKLLSTQSTEVTVKDNFQEENTSEQAMRATLSADLSARHSTPRPLARVTEIEETQTTSVLSGQSSSSLHKKSPQRVNEIEKTQTSALPGQSSSSPHKKSPQRVTETEKTHTASKLRSQSSSSPHKKSPHRVTETEATQATSALPSKSSSSPKKKSPERVIETEETQATNALPSQLSSSPLKQSPQRVTKVEETQTSAFPSQSFSPHKKSTQRITETEEIQTISTLPGKTSSPHKRSPQRVTEIEKIQTTSALPNKSSSSPHKKSSQRVIEIEETQTTSALSGQSSSSPFKKSPQALILAQTVEKKSIDKTPLKPSYSITTQKEMRVEKDNNSAMANLSAISQLESSSLYPYLVTSLDNLSPHISSNATLSPFGSTSMSLQTSRDLLAKLSSRGEVEKFTLQTENSASNLIIFVDLLQELKTKLEGYLDMSLEAICEANALDNVEEIVNSLAMGTTDMIQKNILEDFTSRLKSFKECVPKAMVTLQSSMEFRSNYESLILELNTKLNEGQELVRDLECKLSQACDAEYALDMEIQKLITQKIELLAEKDSLASHLNQSTQIVSKVYEKWEALVDELKLSTNQWLKSKEVIAHANASWQLFKESLGL